MTKSYTKKPITIEAIQYVCDGTDNNIKDVFEFFESKDGRELVFVENT